MLIIFILILNSCLLKEVKSDVKLKEEINLGTSIEKNKLILRIDGINENVEVFLRSEKSFIKGTVKESFYEFSIENEGFYKVFIDSDEYLIKDNKVSIFKFNNNFYYKGPKEFKIKKVLKNEPVVVKNEEEENYREELEEKITKLTNLDIKFIDENISSPQKQPSLVSLKPLINEEIEGDAPQENNKFINNYIEDYIEMSSEVKTKEKLFGEKLKENLSPYKDIISTCADIASTLIFRPGEVDKEEVNKEAKELQKSREAKKAKELELKKEEETKNNSDTSGKTQENTLTSNEQKSESTRRDEVDPEDVEKITLRKQKEEEQRAEAIRKRFTKAVNETIKPLPQSSEPFTKAAEILNKTYDLFKKANN